MYKLYIGLINPYPLDKNNITEDEIDTYNIVAYIEKKNKYLPVKFAIESEIISFGCCYNDKILKKKNYYFYLRQHKLYYFNTYYKYYLHNMKKHPKIILSELIKEVYSPKRIQYLLENYDDDIEMIHC